MWGTELPAILKAVAKLNVQFCSDFSRLKTWYIPLIPLLSIRLEKIPSKYFSHSSDDSREHELEYYHTDLHPQPAAPRQVLCVSPSQFVSSSCKIKVERQNHTAQKKTNNFPKCHPTTRLLQISVHNSEL